MSKLLLFSAVAGNGLVTQGAPWAPLDWHWGVLGLVLMAIEAFLPGAFFLWLGLAAVAVGLVLVIIPDLALTTQVLIYAVLVFVSAAAWYRLRRRGEIHEPGATPLNDRASLYRDRLFTLDAPIVNGVGHLKVDDGQWRINGPDLPVGARVRVREVVGTTLHVDPSPVDPAQR
jgi:membrane protein implicated in regulation of membrane protease activity